MATGDGSIRLMLCGDVMTGRGVDQVLPHPSDPVLYEPYVKSALDYVRLAEDANGPIPKPVACDYAWGDALDAMARLKPDVRIVNLETAVTRAETPWPKGINYRMNPGNSGCLTAAGIDCCVLANNHVIDWGHDGLVETLATLEDAGIATAGAGRVAEEAARPAALPVAGGGRVLVHAFACPSSGAPRDWAAGRDRAGINILERLTASGAERIAERIGGDKRPGDVAICSLHWGGNWGYEVPTDQRAFAHRLLENGAVDVVFGHSAHHAKAIEIHRGKPILYGCGDFLNDYEGIAGHEPYRDDLPLMYLLDIEAGSGTLTRLDMVPFRLRKFRLDRAEPSEAAWLRETMDRECGRFGRGVRSVEEDRAILRLEL